MVVATIGLPRDLWAGSVTLLDAIIDEASPWLFIGTGAENSVTVTAVGDTVDISNFEIGAIKAPVPANNDPPFGDGQDWGPDLAFGDQIPNVPGVTIDVGFNGMKGQLPHDHVITYNGNVAITYLDPIDPAGDRNGGFSLSNVGVFSKNVSNGGAHTEFASCRNRDGRAGNHGHQQRRHYSKHFQ